MLEKEANGILGICDRFCSVNDNNKINEFSSGFFITLIKQELTKIVKKDLEEKLNFDRELKELKTTLKELEKVSKEQDKLVEEVLEGDKKKPVDTETKSKIIEAIDKIQKNGEASK